MIAKTGGEQAPPLRRFAPRCRIATDCSLHVRVPVLGSKLAWNKIHKPLKCIRKSNRRGGPCWPPVSANAPPSGLSPPGQRRMIAKTGGEQAPPLRPFVPPPPDNDRLFPARPRPGPGFETRMERVPKQLKEKGKSNRRGDPCRTRQGARSPFVAHEPASDPVPSRRSPAIARTGGEQAPPLRRFEPTPPDIADCSLHVRVPAPGSKLAWNEFLSN